MKFNAPEGCTSISIGGETINVSKKGQIEVPDDGTYAALLAPHGFTPAPEVAAKQADEQSGEQSGEQADKQAGKKAGK